MSELELQQNIFEVARRVTVVRPIMKGIENE